MKLFTVLAFLLPLTALAQQKPKSDLKPLHFQADKNNLQVLPQRFEYSLWDEDRLSVGDILIDSTQVTFSLEPAEKKNQYRIRFTWPAGLLKEGQLAIKNNTGKAILATELDKETVKISRGTPMEGRENLRSDIASFSTNVDSKIVDDMRYLPFMVFCIYRETEGTRLYLCSKELYLSSQKGQLAVKPRNLNKKEAHVEINGATVGNQGIIYLNDRSEAVNFRGQTQSGSFLEIETRRNDVDFKDVVENGNSLILTASGAEPADEKKVRKISATEWQIALPKERPIVYLKGEGDIPMRQEFNIKGPLPQESFRPYVGAKSASKTYASSLALQVTPPAEGQISPDAQDEKARLEQQGNGLRWSLTGIPSGEGRRYLNVKAGENNYVVSYDTERGAPYALYLGGRYQLPSGLFSANFGGQWWIENFLAVNSSWSRFHWGLALDHQQHLTSKDDYAKVDLTTLELLWRAKAGFNMVDETWGLSLPIQMVRAESDSATMFGLGAFWQKQPTQRTLARLMSWSEVKLQYFPSSSGSNFKVKSAYRLGADAYKKLSPKANWYLKYGAALSQYKYDPAASKEDLQLDLTAAAHWQF
ncbi:hypothetical protein [Bdellovibrio svalbardensis]|uniref:Uncharacterized protein n=1 Tax=Bdellovibrio svalbardensis TaxID=2972972 RepID=A0ABT6DH87_9BACT|nr:hypothetical protein [Bdellovibrio svalbardensis]MDG0816163.1 hypothetical protein [Bdellovibrio svalbardensis]